MLTNDPVYCDRNCRMPVLSASHVAHIRTLVGRACSNEAEARAMFASIVRLHLAWHDWEHHYLIAPKGLTLAEREIYLQQLRYETNTRRVFAGRRRLARLIGGKPGHKAEIELQRRHPRGVPYSVMQHLSANPDVRQLWEEQEREEARTRRPSAPPFPPGWRGLLEEAFDELRRDELGSGGDTNGQGA